MVSIAIADTHDKLIYDIIFIVISNIIGQTLDISDKQQIKTLLWILPEASEPHGVLQKNQFLAIRHHTDIS